MNKKPNKIEPDMKCAPSKKYADGSCFTLESLRTIATSYNNHIKNDKDKIDVTMNKEGLVKTIENKLADKCNDDQTCWLRLPIVKELNNKEIEEDTFRPVGPNKKYEWLSTTHINDVIEQYQSLYKDFVFLGAVPSDFEKLPVLGISSFDFDKAHKEGKTKIGMVINLDEHWKSGSHWVGLYFDLNKNQIYFFDSVAHKPIKRIRKYINKIAKYMYKTKYNETLPINNIIKHIKAIKKLDKNELSKIKNKYIHNLLGGGFDIRYNHIQHQFNNSECGVYSINFVIRLAGGESFDSVINNVTKDEMMNANRKIYFRNVN
jgi:hypothetical protein